MDIENEKTIKEYYASPEEDEVASTQPISVDSYDSEDQLDDYVEAFGSKTLCDHIASDSILDFCTGGEFDWVFRTVEFVFSLTEFHKEDFPKWLEIAGLEALINLSTVSNTSYRGTKLSEDQIRGFVRMGYSRSRDSQTAGRFTYPCPCRSFEEIPQQEPKRPRLYREETRGLQAHTKRTRAPSQSSAIRPKRGCEPIIISDDEGKTKRNNVRPSKRQKREYIKPNRRAAQQGIDLNRSQFISPRLSPSPPKKGSGVSKFSKTQPNTIRQEPMDDDFYLS